MMRMGQTQNTTAAFEKVVTLAKRRAQLRKRLKTAEGEEHDEIEAAIAKGRSGVSKPLTEGLEQVDSGTELISSVYLAIASFRTDASHDHGLALLRLVQR